jgi:hypothetical protein
MQSTPTEKKPAEPQPDTFFIGSKTFGLPLDEHRACILWGSDGTVTIRLGCATNKLQPIKKVIVIQPDQQEKK